MKILDVNRKKTILEVTPAELTLLVNGIIREKHARKKKWDEVEPQYLEELLFHAEMCEQVQVMGETIGTIINKYIQWGVLK